MTRTSHPVALAAAAVIACGTTARAASGYTYTPIVVPNAAEPVAIAVNASGTVLGYWYDSAAVQHCFIFQKGNAASCDEPDAGYGTVPAAINDAGEIVGSYYDTQSIQQGFTYVIATGKFTTVPVGPGYSTTLGGIDKGGVAFGVKIDDKHQAYPFSYKSTIKALPISGLPSIAAVSDNGAILGVDFSSFPYLPYIYAHGKMTTVQLGANTGLAPHGVNNKSVAVGEFQDSSFVEHGFIYANGKTTSVSLNGAAHTALTGINNAGVAVGTGYDSRYMPVGAFIYQKGKVTPFSIPHGSAVAAMGINTAGQITGYYLDTATHAQKAFLATPN